MMTRFGNEDSYNKEIVDSFMTADPPDLLIVVDKLLTGFDAPRNTVLYIDKPLKEHTLLQAIARVNRLHPNKDYGYIVDYRGILGDLDDALTTYAALEGYDAEDIEGTVTGVQEAIDSLPQKHSDLVAFFNPVKNRTDTEALEQYLAEEDLRSEFYELLSDYSKTLKVALASADFFTQTPDKKMGMYKDSLKHYHNLRASTMRRYAEIVDYSEYESRIKALINRHISSSDVEQLNEPVSIFNKEEFEKELAKVKSKSAKADTIAARTKRAITEEWDKDPAFYRKFSKKIKRQLDGWFADHAQVKFAERLQHCLGLMKRHKLGKPKWTLRRMRTKWGSCGPDGRLLLNPELVHASTPCIDYVIVHELCHLIEHNHSKRFYRLLEAVLPDWKERQRKLNSFVIR